MSFLVKKQKYHAYFLHSVFMRRPYLTEEKIENVLLNYEEKVIQENGRIAYHGYDIEAKKFLKVIVEMQNSEQIIFNAYYDRSYKSKIVRK